MGRAYRGVLLAIFLVGAGAAQNGLVTVGPGGTSNGAVTLYGATNSSAAITVNSSGPGSTTAILPFINGSISLESVPTSNLGDVVCDTAADTLANIKTGSFGSVAASGGAGWMTGDTITFTNPTTYGIPAVAIVTALSGAITHASITNPGTGYSATSTPTYTTSGSGTGATVIASSCGPGASASGAPISFTTTYQIPASLLLTSPHLHVAAGLPYWTKSTAVGGPIVTLSAAGTAIYKSSAPTSPVAAAGLGTVWTWDVFAPSTMTPTTASLICLSGFPIHRRRSGGPDLEHNSAARPSKRRV